jgi:hypothetical protein
MPALSTKASQAVRSTSVQTPALIFRAARSQQVSDKAAVVAVYHSIGLKLPHCPACFRILL